MKESPGSLHLHQLLLSARADVSSTQTENSRSRWEAAGQIAGAVRDEKVPGHGSAGLPARRSLLSRSTMQRELDASGILDLSHLAGLLRTLLRPFGAEQSPGGFPWQGSGEGQHHLAPTD